MDSFRLLKLDIVINCFVVIAGMVFAVHGQRLLASSKISQPSSFAFARIPDNSSVSASIDLNGTWQFKAVDEEEWLAAHIPSTVWSDLIRAGRLEHPFYRDNELKAQWVEKKEWEYRRTFQVDESFLKHDKIILECRGLDTIAEVYLNQMLVAKTQNMFIEYEFDVKSLLRVGENQLHIIFRSIFEWDRQQVASEPKVTWPNSKGRTFFTRKEASDFGWDWGVRLVTSGIWRSIRLAAYDVGRITDLEVRQDLSNPQNAILRVTAEIERLAEKKLSLEIQVLLDSKVISRSKAAVAAEKVSAQLAIKKPKLWWPNGWGDQPLYTVTANLRAGKKVVHMRKTRIGLRTIELVREKDGRGETFGFKVNGHLIFCKGANWVPADALPDRLTEQHYTKLLRSCVDANMNMLRLWAGGLYEADVFYDFCDENGLLIWHDFMFAVGPVIANESYLENVREEITNVVRRLRNHPSIALWCGNNEVESNMPGANKWLQTYDTVTWEDYDKIFNEVIPQTAALYDPDRPYWPASPHHPLDREKTNPDYETASGDAHLWDVWHSGQPFSWYAENLDYRFVSEFGFQSLPTMATIRSFTAPEDRYFITHVLDHHNKAGHKPDQNIGNVRIARYIATMFRMPKDFENWVYVSQVMHGKGIKIGVEAFRRNFPNTTGALYWQVNDNWPTISGSGMDYYGRWKALQYIARHFFNPVLISGWVEGTRVKIWGVNDLLKNTVGTLQWKLARFDGTEVKRGEQKVWLPANTSKLIADLDFEKQVGENPDYVTYRKDSYENRRKYYLVYKLMQSDRELSSDVSFFVPYKYLPLPDPNLKYKIKEEDGQQVVTITAERFAVYVEVGLRNSYARFSDNYFHLLPGEAKKIEVLESEVSEGEFKKQFYVKSLVDSYKVRGTSEGEWNGRE